MAMWLLCTLGRPMRWVIASFGEQARRQMTLSVTATDSRSPFMLARPTLAQLRSQKLRPRLQQERQAHHHRSRGNSPRRQH